MKRKVRVFKRSVLSLVLCLSLVVSPLAGTGLEVAAEGSGGGSPAVQADNVVYLEEDFDDLEEAKKFIFSYGNDKTEPPANVTKGSLIFKAGQRTNAKEITCNASILDDNNNKYLDINEDGMATASRGIAFLFNYQDSNQPPTVEELKSSGGMLQFSMDITTTGAFNILNFATVKASSGTYTGGKIPAIPAAADGSKRHFRAIIDGANQKQYVIVTEAAGALVSSTIEDLTATGFDEVNFYTASTKAQIDNIRVETVADVGLFTIKVTDGTNALESAKVMIGAVEQTTDASGNAVFALPYGDYTVKVSKEGYQASDGEETASESITMGADSSSKEVALSAMSYTAEPTAVTVEGGQSFIAASKDDTPAQSKSFTVSVKDQKNAVMGSDAYQVTWSILPEGKAEADPNVTIDTDGKISVTKDFHTDDKVAVFEVTATATANGKSAVNKATILIANSSIVYYEPLEWSIASSVRGPEDKTLKMPVSMEETKVYNVILDITFSQVPRNESGKITSSTIGLLAEGVNVTGIQYQNDAKNSPTFLGLKGWTGWKNNTVFNAEGAANNFDNSGIIATFDSDDSRRVQVSFAIDNDAKKITISNGTESTDPLLISDALTTITGIRRGMYRYDAATIIHSILVEEAEPELPAPEITGPESVTKETGKAVEKTYTAAGAEGETFTWSVKAEAADGSTDGIAIDENGKLTVQPTAAAGTYVIIAASESDAERKAEIKVTVREAVLVPAANYLILNATGNETAIDSSAIIPKEGLITGYQITLADADKKLLSKKIVDTLPAKVDTTGAAKVEIAPVYYSIMGAPGELGTEGTAKSNIELPEAGTYDFKVTSTHTKRTDVYVNGQMLVNNLLQHGTTPNFMEVKDIVLKDKTAKIRTADYSSGDGAANQKIEVQIVKSPEIVDRVRKVYVLGDSLVAVYYNNGAENKDAQTGWGQVLQNYLKDSVEVVDLANSGSTAYTLEPTAFTQIRESAKEGDILLLESAYNDQKKENSDGTPVQGWYDKGGLDNWMAAALKEMIADAETRKMDIILVSPNASQHDYRESVSWTSRMEEVVADVNKDKKTVDYIDLSQLSYDFLKETYGADGDAVKEILLADWNIASDRLHSKYGAAHKWASVVAGALKETHPDIVNTEYCYTFTDLEGRTIFCTAGEIPADMVVTLTYEMNGHGKQYESTKVVKGSKLKALTPTEADYAFKGWYKDEELTQKWDFDTDTVGDADFTLYAKWEEQKGVLYRQDFEDAKTAADVDASINDTKISIASDQRGKYLLVDWTGEKHNGGRGSRIDFKGLDVSNVDAYIVEFDALIVPGNEQKDHLAVMSTDFKYIEGNSNYGADSGYLLKLDNNPTGSAYAVNDGLVSEKITISSGTWHHYKLYIDKKAGVNGLVSITIAKEGASVPVVDKLVSAYKGSGNVQGIYMMVGRYYGKQAIDNVLVREVAADDEFGEIPKDETLKDIEFVAALNKVITQTAGGAAQHFPVTVKANGSMGGDLTDKVSVKWSMGGMDKADGYVSLTKAEGTDKGTAGDAPDGATAYFNVRDGVGNLFGYVQAEVTYQDETRVLRTPVAVLGSADMPAGRLAPAAGYPVSMDEYGDSLIGYMGTSQDINSKDIVLNNWSIYGSNNARSFSLVEINGKKALKFSNTGGSGSGGSSTVAVYQWTDQTKQYVMDMTVQFTAAMTFGVYFNTPNNGYTEGKENLWPNPEWEVSYGSGALTLGTKSISGINANEWYRIVVSADPSIQKVSLTVYNSKGEKLGEIEEEEMTNPTANHRYFCFMGTWPMYLNSFEAYKPQLGTITVNSDTDTVKVPEAGEAAVELSLNAGLLSTGGLKMTGVVTWMLPDENPGVEIVSDGKQGAALKISSEASGTVRVVAAMDGKTAEKTIQLTTSSNVVSFKTSTGSITIPFEGKEAVVNTFEAVTLKGDGSPAEDGGAITYSLLGSDGMTELASLPKGVTFDNGVLTVAAGASPVVLYVKAANEQGLSGKVKVNIHGLSFAFGSAEVEEGFTQVKKEVYTDTLGFGFLKSDGLTVNGDNVTGAEAFRFKAKVPNGNYTVKVNTTAASMKSEVVESITSIATGIEKTGASFSVAVCDGVLDLTFPAEASVKSIEISQMAPKKALEKPMIYAIGDSTAKNTANGAKSWGNCAEEGLVELPDVFGGFENHGWGGKNSVSYYNLASVEGVLLAICPGDYVTVNMGINSETGEPAAYYTLMKEYYVQGILQRGGIPVIVTATPDGPVGDRLGTNYNSAAGKFTNSRGDGAQNNNMRKIAQELNVKLIELGQWGEDWMNTLTMDDVTAYNTANKTNYTTVLEMVQSWYVDHNHYKEPLGKQIAWYLFSELAKLAGGEAPERPGLGQATTPEPEPPKPEGTKIIEDFETTTDWELTGGLAGNFSVKADGKSGHYLVGDGKEIGAGNVYAKKVFADLPDMETVQVTVDWIANSEELKTQDKKAYYALQLWSEEMELVSLYVSDLRGNAAAKVYYSTTGIGDRKDTGVTLKQGQTLKVSFALDFGKHTLSIYLDGTEVASDVSFNGLATKAEIFAMAALDDTEGKKKYPNFAVDNFELVYTEATTEHDFSKLVRSLKTMPRKDHSKVADLSEFEHPTGATVVMGDGKELEVEIDGTTWKADREIDFAEIGTYTWTAELIMPEGISNPNKVKASYVMQYLASYQNTDINTIDAMPVVTLTKAEYEAGYVQPQTVTARLMSGSRAGIEIDQSTWKCEPEFDPNVRGIYVWTAQLKDNGVNGNPRKLTASYTMHYQAAWVSDHDIEEDFLFGYPGWDVWGKDIDETSGTGGFSFELKKDGNNPYLYATQADSGKNRGSRMNLSGDIVKGAVMEFDFMPAVVNGGHTDLLFVAPAYKQNYFSLLVGADGKVSYHTTEDLNGNGKHPTNNTFDGVISSGSPVATGVGAIGKWMHVKAEFDYLAHTASLTVTSKENPDETYTVSDIPIDDRANGLSIMVVRKLSGCSRAEVAFDNVIVDYDKFGAADIVKLAQPKDVSVAESEFDKFVLPAEVKATLGDNSTVMVPVGEWKSTPKFERGVPGTYVWTAEIDNGKLGLTNYFGLSLSFTMTYTMLPFPVYVFNPNTVELTYGDELPEQFPTEVDARMSDGSNRRVKLGEWTAIRAFDSGKEGIYVYGANVISVPNDYDVVPDMLSPNENPDAIRGGDEAEYKYNVYYRISYFKDDVDNYNGYERTMEKLDRGVYAVATGNGVFVSWRLLADEYGKDISFEVYRNGEKVTTVSKKTNYQDPAGKKDDVYTIVKIQDGLTFEGAQAKATQENYLSIPVQKPDPQPDKNGNLSAYTLNDMGVADVDGDGEYEYIVKWLPDNGFDSGNADAPSSPTIFDLYELDGTPLWRLNLGLELPSGAHFNQFMLYDLDEDGKAELFIKTSDGSISYKPNAAGRFDMNDGTTIVSSIGDQNIIPGDNIEANGHVNPNTNEFVTVFDGATGKEIDTIKYVNKTGSFGEWGDNSGNRSARYNIAIAYLPRDKSDANCKDTIPAVLFNRGYYNKTTVAAYTLRDGKLTLEWNFVRANNSNEAGKGNHNMSTGDIDKDGFDELIIGAMAIDHDGSVLWVKDGKEGQDFAGHADTIHLAMMNPDSNDLYVFTPNEEADHATMNAAVVNARTGARISGSWFTMKDVGRAIAANITPKAGYEYWSASTGSGIYAFDGSEIAGTIPVAENWRMFWDGDLLSELGDGVATDGNWAVTKYNWENNTVDTLAVLEGSKTNNYTKKTPGLTADLFGDWREEVMLRNEDDTEIRIYMTTEETDYMIYTLMHDPVYRNAVANQNTSYNQPPHVGFYLGEDNKDTVLAMGLPTAKIKYGASKEEKVTIAEPQETIAEPTDKIKEVTECDTVRALTEYLKKDVIQRSDNKINFLNTMVQEIVVKISVDGGEHFEPATAKNFPKEGVKVVLPYPNAVKDKWRDYNFVVSHLITMTCNGLEEGDIVEETANKTEAGLEIIVKSASPFTIGWYKESQNPSQPENTPAPTPEITPVPTPEITPVPTPEVTSSPSPTDTSDQDDDDEDEPLENTADEKVGIPAKTGDHMGSLLWLCIAFAVIAASGITAVLSGRYRRRK